MGTGFLGVRLDFDGLGIDYNYGWAQVRYDDNANTMTLAAGAWPRPEPIRMNYGERGRLTMVNDTMMNHPMHLHGFYFQVMRRGSVLADSATGGRLAVTEDMSAGSTMSMQWTPDRNAGFSRADSTP